MLLFDQLFKLKYVSPLAEARMPKHVCVPKRMQLTRISATIRTPNFLDWNIIAAARISDCVEWLMNVSGQVDDPLESLLSC
jgi:hypothetical protein